MMMKDKSKGLIAQAAFTPVAVTALAVISWRLSAHGGIAFLMPIAWLVGFFILGLSGLHGLFYICALPLPENFQQRPLAIRFIQAYWFLQMPFAWFNGIKPEYSIIGTQAVIALAAITYSIITGMKKQAEQTAGGD